MSTRSKLKKNGTNPPSSDDIDDRGNIKGLIDYSEDEEYDSVDFNNQIFNLSKGRMGKKKKPKKSKKDEKINNMMMSYLIMKATEKANEELKKRRCEEKKSKKSEEKKSKKIKNKIKVVESEQDNKDEQIVEIDINPKKNMTILDYIYEDTTDDDSYVNEDSEEESEEDDEEDDE